MSIADTIEDIRLMLVLFIRLVVSENNIIAMISNDLEGEEPPENLEFR